MLCYRKGLLAYNRHPAVRYTIASTLRCMHILHEIYIPLQELTILFRGQMAFEEHGSSMAYQPLASHVVLELEQLLIPISC